ncbi:unnamed protein product [Calypogeia fissa]
MAVVSAASSSCLGVLSSSSSFSVVRADPPSCVLVYSSSNNNSSHIGLRRSSPLSLSLRSPSASVAFRNSVYTHQGQRWRPISCEATWRGRDFENQVGRMAEDVRKKATDAARAFTRKVEEFLNNAKSKAVEFGERSDLRGKASRAAQTANRKFEEFGYDARRTAAKWDREYRISEMVQGAREFTVEQIQNADRQLGFRQKARNISSDFKLKWPTYRRQLGNFFDTPIGKSFVTLFMVWLVFSGWLFRILLLSMWILPLAAPLLLNTLSKAAIVEGSCPNCGQRYIGGRNQAVTCTRCKGVVWQPRQDFSKDSSDPRIIDIDIDPK